MLRLCIADEAHRASTVSCLRLGKDLRGHARRVAVCVPLLLQKAHRQRSDSDIATVNANTCDVCNAMSAQRLVSSQKQIPPEAQISVHALALVAVPPS